METNKIKEALKQHVHQYHALNTKLGETIAMAIQDPAINASETKEMVREWLKLTEASELFTENLSQWEPEFFPTFAQVQYQHKSKESGEWAACPDGCCLHRKKQEN